jgi:hypothetical protein
MLDKSTKDELLDRPSHLASLAERLQTGVDKGQQVEEDSCPAFGYLRNHRDRALAVEFRLRNGTSVWYPYSWLGPWQFNPSAGLLLKFTGDVVTLILIRGSNLGMVLPQNAVNLTDNGFQRHRVLWVREMDEVELRKTGERGPTIDRIEIAEFESHEDQREWLKKTAPAFLRTTNDHCFLP